MMRKRKIYLDTSVISHLKSLDVPDKMDDTWRLWSRLEEGREFQAVTSDVTLAEILQCPGIKRDRMIHWVTNLGCEILAETEKVRELAKDYIDRGILSAKQLEDVLHIAFAVTSHCDCIASWNFKHIVNPKTIDGVNAANILNGYPQIKIVSPTLLMQGDDNE